MKRVLVSAFLLAAVYMADAQPLRTPQPSVQQNVQQDFALTKIELSYARPSARGRKVFGDLVPFDKVWRTGANGATTLSFGDEVIIGGQKIPAGKYGLLSIPGKSEWTLILTRQTDVTSPAAYKQENDVVRVKVKAVTSPSFVETFTIQFANNKPTSIDLQLMWEKTMVTLPIGADIDSKVMAQIEAAMKSERPPYFNAAMYYLENGKDLNQALAWFDKAIEAQPTAFWVHYNRANCLAKLGKKADAKAAAEKSIELAKAAKNDDYVALNEKLLKTLK